MRNLRTKILYSIFLLVAIGVLPARSASPPRVYLDLNAVNVAPGSEVEVTVLVSVAEPINAFDIVFKYQPELLTFLRASTENSIASIWQSLPREKDVNDGSGSLRLVGGLTTPFSGNKGEIITLIFRANTAGRAELATLKSDLALADGKGTLLHTLAEQAIVRIEGSAELTVSEPKLTLPKIREVVLTEDPLTNTSLVSIRTEDDGGVREMQIRARSWFRWSDWSSIEQQVAPIPKYAWAVELLARGWGDEETHRVIYLWNIAGLKFLVVLMAIALLWVVLRYIFKMWKRTHITNT